MLIAISILTLAVGAPLALIAESLKVARFTQTRLEAQYLAAEGIEVIKAHKNFKVLGTPTLAFTTGLFSCLPAGGGACGKDVFNNGVSACGSIDGCVLKYIDSAECSNADIEGCERQYGHHGSFASAPESPFTRVISVTELSPNEAQVVVTVSWEEDGDTKTITLVDYIRSFGSDS